MVLVGGHAVARREEAVRDDGMVSGRRFWLWRREDPARRVRPEPEPEGESSTGKGKESCELGGDDFVGNRRGGREVLQSAHVHVAFPAPERANDMAQSGRDQDHGTVATRDSATHFSIDHLPKGTNVFEHSTRVRLREKCQSGIAGIQCTYAPKLSTAIRRVLHWMSDRVAGAGGDRIPVEYVVLRINSYRFGKTLREFAVLIAKRAAPAGPGRPAESPEFMVTGQPRPASGACDWPP